MELKEFVIRTIKEAVDEWANESIEHNNCNEVTEIYEATAEMEGNEYDESVIQEYEEIEEYLRGLIYPMVFDQLDNTAKILGTQITFMNGLMKQADGYIGFTNFFNEEIPEVFAQLLKEYKKQKGAGGND